MPVSFVEILFFSIVAAVLTFTSALLTRGKSGSFIITFGLGAVGAALGWLLAIKTGYQIYCLNILERDIPVIWTTTGSAFFIAAISLLTRKKINQDNNIEDN